MKTISANIRLLVSFIYLYLFSFTIELPEISSIYTLAIVYSAQVSTINANFNQCKAVFCRNILVY